MYKKLLIILIIVSFLLFLIINIPSPLRVEGDGVFYYSWLRSALFDCDFDFYNELEHFSSYDVGSKWMLDNDFKTHIGKAVNPYAYGTALMWLPLFIVANIFSVIFMLPTDGYSVLYVLAINLSSWIFGALSLFVVFNILRRFFSSNLSFLTTLGVYLATPWVYYQFWEPSMSHMASLLMVSLFLYLIIKIWQGERVSLLLMGLVVFLMVATRWQNLLFGIIFLPILWKYRRDIKSILGVMLASAFSVLFFWITQLLLWKHLYGYYLLQPQGRGFVRFDFHGFYILFSSNRGLLLWSPIIILAFLGFYYLYQKSKFLFFISILVFIAQWFLNGSLNDLGGGDAFGARRFIETLPFLAIALAAFFEHLKFKKTTWVVVMVLIICNLILIENYRHGIIPHHGEFDVLGVILNV